MIVAFVLFGLGFAWIGYALAVALGASLPFCGGTSVRQVR
jgi:hypothetical protein